MAWIVDKESGERRFEQDNAESQSPLDLAAIDIEDRDQLRKLAKTELLHVIKQNRGNLGVVAALRELLDRIDGKPQQTQVMEVKNTTTINYTATDRFLESLGITVIEN